MIYRLVFALPVAAIIGIPMVQRVTSHAGSHTVDALDSDHGQRAESFNIFANGIVEGRHRDVPLHFEIAGRLVSIEVRQGDTVAKGQVLARLDASEWDIELQQAKAELQRAQAQRDLLVAGTREEARKTARADARVAYEAMASAKTHLERTSKLAGKRVTTDQELDDRKAAFNTSRANYKAALARVEEIEAAARTEELSIAEANIALAKTRVDHARLMLEKTELKASFDGVVLQRWGELGQLVGPESQRPIAVMVDATQKRVRAFVEELDAMRVQPGSPVFVTADGMPEERILGHVIDCAPCMVPKVNFSNRPNERVDVRVREVMIVLNEGDLTDLLVVGLPIDVFLQPNASSSEREVGLHAGERLAVTSETPALR